MRGEGRTNLKLKRGLVTNSASPSSHTVWLEEKLDLQAKGPIIYYLFDARSRSPYQDINKVSSFSRCLVGTKCYLSSLIFYCQILERLLHTLTRGLLAVVGGVDYTQYAHVDFLLILSSSQYQYISLFWFWLHFCPLLHDNTKKSVLLLLLIACTIYRCSNSHYCLSFQKKKSQNIR